MSIYINITINLNPYLRLRNDSESQVFILELQHRQNWSHPGQVRTLPVVNILCVTAGLLLFLVKISAASRAHTCCVFPYENRLFIHAAKLERLTIYIFDTVIKPFPLTCHTLTASFQWDSILFVCISKDICNHGTRSIKSSYNNLNFSPKYLQNLIYSNSSLGKKLSALNRHCSIL